MSDASITSKPFFVTGGTLHLDATSYVTRKADADLLAALLESEYCYVLNSRQMGKSSLCVRTIAKLSEQGATPVFLDLTKFGGSNLSSEQWYAGLLSETGRSLGVRKEFLLYWKDHSELSPLQRYFGALQEVALNEIQGRIVLFIDEIDVTRSLAFSADEFFAAIRQLYVGRSQEPSLRRIAFCLLGTATPAELIQDTRVSPFNIGRRIALADFTAAEALVLAQGLPEGERLLQRILYWTNGHPYLTQRLCVAVAESPSPNVDSICRELFLTRTARESDDNLMFVRNRLLKSEVDLASLLEMLRRIRTGSRVLDDEADPLKGVLKLSGVAREENGTLKMRNRIYSEVFDKSWIESQMPDAELRRQKAAYRQGWLRALSLSSVVLALFAAVAGVANNNALRERIARADADAQRKTAQRALAEAQEQRRLAIASGEQVLQYAEEVNKQKGISEANAQEALNQRTKTAQALAVAQAQKRKADANLVLAKSRLTEANAARGEARAQLRAAERASYTANMNLIPREWESGNIGHVLELLEKTRNYWNRGFEWGYWNRRCHLDLLTYPNHAEKAESAAFSPDGAQCVTAGGSADAWDAATGKRLFPLRGGGKVRCVAYSPDGKRIASANDDGMVRIWSRAAGKALLEFKGHDGAVISVAFSRDGTRLATGGIDNAARIWDSATGRELKTFQGHSDYVYGAVFSPDGRRIATSSRDNSAKVWDVATGKETFALKGFVQPLRSICFSPNGRQILTAGWDATARVFDSATGKEMFVLKHPDAVHSAVFSPDGKRILTACWDNVARVWDVASRKEILLLKGHTAPVYSAVFSPDGKRVLTASADKTAKIWDAESSREFLATKTYPASVLAAALSKDGDRAAVAGSGTPFSVWESVTGKEAFRLKDNAQSALSVAFSPDGKQVVIGKHDNSALVTDSVSGVAVLTLKGHANQVSAVAFSPDGKRIATGSIDKSAKIWDAKTGKELATLHGHTETVNSICYSPDGGRILTASSDKTAIIWEVATGKPLLTLRGHTEYVAAAIFSPDGKRIATASWDRNAIIWDAATGKPLLTLTGHTEYVTAICFSSDGKQVVTGSLDGSAKVWDSASGEELLSLKGHSNTIVCAALSKDGKRILTASYDGTAKVWAADFEAGGSLPKRH